MVTIKDVAEKAGVSKTTVSRILNSQGNFSKATIEKVYRVMEELNYQPNEVARTLGRRQSNMLALILPNRELPVFGVYTAELEKAAYEKGYRIMLCSSFYDKEEELKSIQLLRNNMVDGIIYGGFNTDISHFSNIDLPIVSVGRKIDSAIPVVKADNLMAGKLACHHLKAKGCRKIIYITGYLAGEELDEKYIGIREMMRGSDMVCYVYRITMEMQINNMPDPVINQALLDHPDADGIITETDLLAMKCIQICSSFGYDIPSKIKLVGFGNYFFSTLSTPLLTTIAEPVQKICQAAVEKLISIINGEDSGRQDEDIPVALIERKTT